VVKNKQLLHARDNPLFDGNGQFQIFLEEWRGKLRIRHAAYDNSAGNPEL
jgi:hypothetical protein